MNILYYGFTGHSSNFFGFILLSLGIIMFITGVILYLKDNISGIGYGFGSLIAIAIILCGVLLFPDTRVPIIKATVNDTIPWIQVVKDYEYIENEGNIYTFKVLNKTKEEWETYIHNE